MRHPFQVKVGVALGGGAARGIAHIGVLRALVREGIPIDIIAGTSMGAILGGAFAAGRDIADIEAQIREILSSEEFRNSRLSFLKESRERRKGWLHSFKNLVRKGIVYGVSNWKTSFLSAEAFTRDIDSVVPDIRVEDTRIPFGAVALDLEQGSEVVLCHGNLRSAVTASSSIPGILPPVEIGGRTLIDGGWIDKLPVLPAYRMGADVVIAVDISADLQDTRDYRRGVDIMLRANAIKDDILIRFTRALADVVIEPSVKHLHWADFDHFDTCIQAGDDAATLVVPAIREAIRHRRWQNLLRPSVGRRLAERYVSAEDLTLCLE